MTTSCVHSRKWAAARTCPLDDRRVRIYLTRQIAGRAPLAMRCIAMSDRIGHAWCRTMERPRHASSNDGGIMTRKLIDILFRLAKLQSWLDCELGRPRPNPLLLLRLKLLRLRLKHRLSSLKLAES